MHDYLRFIYIYLLRACIENINIQNYNSLFCPIYCPSDVESSGLLYPDRPVDGVWRSGRRTYLAEQRCRENPLGKYFGRLK